MDVFLLQYEISSQTMLEGFGLAFAWHRLCTFLNKACRTFYYFFGAWLRLFLSSKYVQKSSGHRSKKQDKGYKVFTSFFKSVSLELIRPIGFLRFLCSEQNSSMQSEMTRNRKKTQKKEFPFLFLQAPIQQKLQTFLVYKPCERAFFQ